MMEAMRRPEVCQTANDGKPTANEKANGKASDEIESELVIGSYMFGKAKDERACRVRGYKNRANKPDV